MLSWHAAVTDEGDCMPSDAHSTCLELPCYIQFH